MNLRIIIFLAFIFLAFTACKSNWDDHYNVFPETVDENVWEAMISDETISQFVNLLKENKLDTLFQSDNAFTVFAPTNKAMESMDPGAIDTTLLKYHLMSQLMQSESINGKRLVRTLTKKYALFEEYGDEIKIDGIPIGFESPLYKNGKYFVIDQVARPKQNLYEFFAKNNPVLKEYIDSQDSIVLDLERSKPIGFNDEGNTVFDSVKIIYNLFEEDFFPVRREYRNKTATIVFPLKEDYQNALTEMAQKIGGGYVDYQDIPSLWQQKVLVPFLLNNGVFENMLEPEQFVLYENVKREKMKNILDDSIRVTYKPTRKMVCSNGYAYDYTEFHVPDSLYNKASRFEMELLLDETGINKYAWGENVTIKTDETLQAFQEYIGTASNDSIIRVLFPLGYTGQYSVEFKTQYLFPRKYVMVVNTNMDNGGIYDIYVNDVLVKTFDFYDFIKYKGIMPSVVTGGRYKPVGRFNSFDMYVNNITTFSRAKVRFEYKGPGRVSSQGLVLDYIEFLPVAN